MKLVILHSLKTRQWYFHLKARNGKIVSQSEGYKRHRSLMRTIESIGHAFAAGKITIVHQN